MKSCAPVRVLCPPAPRRLRVLACLALALVVGCTAPRERRPYDPGTEPLGRGAPGWVGQPEGWAKLDAIDRWLAGDAVRYDPYWRVQGELALADGRAAFADTELEREGTRTSRWQIRVESARSGYGRVLADPLASSLQLDLARAGLARIDRIDGGSSTPVPPGGVLPRSSWRARLPVASRLTATRGGYQRITIHHTADVPGARFDGNLADSVGALRSVQRNHMDNRRYGDIGYHFLIDATGRTFHGRDLTWQGAHAGGINNRNNIGICLLGNFEKTRPTAASLEALTKLLAELRATHEIPASAVVGHRHWKSTLCPGAHLARWTNDYRRNGPRLGSLSGSPREASAKRAPTVRNAPAPRSYAASGAVR